MKKNFPAKPYIFPQPVLIIGTYDENDIPNAMNAAWGGVADDNEIMVCLGSHKTTQNLALHKACTIAIGDTPNVVACDYVGLASGTRVNKLQKAGWTTTPSQFVHAPVIDQLPISMDCTLIKIVDDCKYFFRVENVSVDERILTDGKVDFAKFHPLCYDTALHGYHELGARVGNAFADGKKIK